jgi:hypothetical protein
LNDDLMADERLAAPVLGEEREQPALDLVQSSGGGRQMTAGDGEAKLVGQLLQLEFRQSHAGTVAAPPSAVIVRWIALG